VSLHCHGQWEKERDGENEFMHLHRQHNASHRHQQPRAHPTFQVDYQPQLCAGRPRQPPQQADGFTPRSTPHSAGLL
jgi:hypothetical protein